MDDIPAFDEQEIEERVGPQSFERGEGYFRDGAIFATRRQGTTLKARCQGTLPEPYRLWVTFDGETISQADCSCPVGQGGYCKHVAALLLTWLDTPEVFEEQQEVGPVLQQRTKDELIALIKQMLRQEPDLETLLDLPLPTPGKRAEKVDVQAYRHQAAAAFRNAGDEWGAEAGIAEDLLAITEIGDGFVEQQDYAIAAAVYEGVSAEVLDHYEEYSDEEGELGSIISECVEGLGNCLVEQKDSAEREAILRALFAIYRSDLDFGGVGLGGEAPGLVMEHATPEERHTVATWVREELLHSGGETDDWRRRAYGGFLLDLEEDSLDEESFIRICRETGRTSDLVDRLLDLGRVDEAMEEAERVGDYPLIELADLFVEHGYGSMAEGLILERSGTTQDSRVLEWLKDRYKTKGRQDDALQLAERLFRMRPSLDGYKEARRLAEQLGKWGSLRPALLDLLNQTPHLDLLVRIYLDDGDVDSALGLMKRGPEGGPTYFYGDLVLEVAQAAESVRPEAALEIYRQQAERLIDMRGREFYREASALLSRVQALHRQLGQEGVWDRYIADLRERHRALRALKEELSAAGL